MDTWVPPKKAVVALQCLTGRATRWQSEVITDQASADSAVTALLSGDGEDGALALCIQPRSPITIGDRLSKFDLVFVCGEVGDNAHPLHPDFVRSIRDECAAAGVPFVFGGWGEWIPRSQTNDRKPWHASRLPDESGLARVFWPMLGRGNSVAVAPEPRPPGGMITDWGTIDQNGRWWEQTTPWNGHDDDGDGEVVMYRVGADCSGACIDGVEHGIGERP